MLVEKMQKYKNFGVKNAKILKIFAFVTAKFSNFEVKTIFMFSVILDKIACGGAIMLVQALSPCNDEMVPNGPCEENGCGTYYCRLLGKKFKNLVFKKIKFNKFFGFGKNKQFKILIFDQFFENIFSILKTRNVKICEHLIF